MKEDGQNDISPELFEKILTEMCGIPFEKWLEYHKHNRNSRRRRINYEKEKRIN